MLLNVHIGLKMKFRSCIYVYPHWEKKNESQEMYLTHSLCITTVSYGGCVTGTKPLPIYLREIHFDLYV